MVLNVVAEPAHIEISGPAFAVARGFSETVTAASFVQPLEFETVTE